MSVIRFSFILFGMALLAAPSLVSAQQSNAQLLMEVQALRAEIAELRDMVERQQYQLDRMRSGAPVNPRTGLPANLPNAQQPINNGARDIQPSAQTEGNYPPAQQPQITNPQQTGGGQAYPPQQPVPQNADNDGFYQPDTGAEPAVNDPAQNQPAEPPATDNSNYPPVEDRSVGGDSAATTPRPSVSADGQTANQPEYSSNGQLGPGIPSTGDANTQGSVIPVPTAGSQVSYNQLPGQNENANNQTDTPAVPAQISEQELYQRAFDLLKQRKHEDAVAVFKEQLELYPKGDAADDANYWIAETSYVNRDLKESKKYFKTIIEEFPQSSRLPDALLKTAYIEQEQGNKIEARILLQEIVHYHPRSNAAISAKNRLTELN